MFCAFRQLWLLTRRLRFQINLAPVFMFFIHRTQSDSTYTAVHCWFGDKNGFQSVKNLTAAITGDFTKEIFVGSAKSVVSKENRLVKHKNRELYISNQCVAVFKIVLIQKEVNRRNTT